MSNNLLGVDIGASNIKIVELKETKSGFAVKNIFLARTPASTVVDGSVIDHGAVSKVISDTIAHAKGIQKDAALAIHGADVIVKKLKLPWNGKGNFQETFLWSAEQYMGISAERASFDAQLISFDMERQIAETVLAAASKDKIADLLTAASQSGLEPIVVDIEALALVNLITQFKGAQGHVNAIIDIGHDAVRIIFYENGHVDSITTIFKGGKFMAEDLAKDMEIDPEKAEDILRDTEAMDSDADAQAAAMAYGSSIGSEIETAIEVYMQEKGKEPIDFYACGAVSYVSEVLSNIETSMGVSVSHIDPFKYIEIPANLRPIVDASGAGTFAVAAGLAMRKS
ncbi:MAG: hypothetical protein C0603_13315 [Denitrovibrio sp.]|nr:MAG: hypothetical protein C0603_13315 [Denitrovibrio sp.]